MICTLIVAATAANAAETESLRIAKWKNDAKGAVALFYDDGTDSAFDIVRPALVRRSIPGTFYLYCGRGTGEDDPKVLRWGTAAKAAPGIVVLGDHTWLHKDFADAAQFDAEIARNGALVRKLMGLPPEALVSYARPGGIKFNVTDDEEATVLAAHGELKRPKYWPNSARPIGSEGGMQTAAQAIEGLDRAEANGGLECYLFHGVGGDWISFSATEHERFLAELDRRRAEGRIWPASTIAVQKFIAERDAATLSPSPVPDGAIAAATLSFATDPALYDEPLTIVAALPEDREVAEIFMTCSGVRSRLRAPVIDGRAIFDIAPSSEPVSIIVK